MILWANNSDWAQSSGPSAGLLWDLRVCLQSVADHLGGCASGEQQCWATCLLTSSRLAQACSQGGGGSKHRGSESFMCSWGQGLDLAQHHTCHVLLVKESHKAKRIQEMEKETSFLDRNSVTYWMVSYLIPIPFRSLLKSHLIGRIFPEHPIKIVLLPFHYCPKTAFPIP